jgi:transglutaminase-like putative cysteine protease
MRNPRQIFILVGFLAQSLTWDSYAFAIGSTILWLLAVTAFRDKFQLRLSTEALALVLGCAVSLTVSRILHRSAHFFIGDGLVALQVVRLIRPLNRREKLTSVVIACFHFGVLCTLAPNLRFILLYIAGLYLLPGALRDAFHDREPTPYTSRLKLPPDIQLLPTMRVCLWLLLGSVFVFLTFPRFTGSPLQLRDVFAEQGSLLDNILDPRQGGRANSPEVLLQIEGLDIGYLRCFALTEFDGVKWSAPEMASLYTTNWPSRENFEHKKRYFHRKVYVKNSHYLGGKIPVDGPPAFMAQTFFKTPSRNRDSDALESLSVWAASQNIYEYFVDSKPEPEFLLPELRQRLVVAPAQSERLTNWLASVTQDGTNALHKARLLERFLRDNFRYKIGTPDLNRLAPTDDFIFNRQEGHCERFAASLALFLRMQGVPSRIAVGYVPSRRNMFTGRMQVRFRDAHSWTEGYFDGLGWLKFDATPGPPPGTQSSDFLDMVEELEFAWYSHVVNFNGFAQRDLIAATAGLLEKVPSSVWTGFSWGLALLLIAGILARSRLKTSFKFRLPSWKRRLTPEAVARHYYDEMLHALQKRGHEKNSAETPFEFLRALRAKTDPRYTEATVVTDNFCRSFYGGKVLTPEEQEETLSALTRLKNGSDHHLKRS